MSAVVMAEALRALAYGMRVQYGCGDDGHRTAFEERTKERTIGAA